MRYAERPAATCEVKLDGERVVLGVAGELSLASAYPLVTALRRAAPGANACAVDLGGVESASPGGIEALREVLEAARSLFRVVTLEHAELIHAHL